MGSRPGREEGNASTCHRFGVCGTARARARHARLRGQGQRDQRLPVEGHPPNVEKLADGRLRRARRAAAAGGRDLRHAKQMAQLRRKTKVRAEARARPARPHRPCSARSARSAWPPRARAWARSSAATRPPGRATRPTRSTEVRRGPEDDGNEQYTEFYNRILNQHPDITEKVRSARRCGTATSSRSR